ncbi:F6I1.3 protein [Galdieria sulphuraria]|uniref:F6I1.3 protein n=1 Tax=Galdieria sulphuraria TaxID=130081 RepID=M2XQY2_GALSU|nr:F6I1.3 protein [Galdieria sulphuraria]EME25829.1 F6I1.3 protein [Galdieria sulphuraria]|eukprot:XP_005702349.1 F6I1.3 protein [Galdieria sulphuraria]
MGNCVVVGRSTQETDGQHTTRGIVGGWFKGKSKKGSTGSTWNGIVQLPKPWKAEPPFGPLTETELKRMREEFWDTRTEGRQEMWQALKAAAETTEDTLRNEIVKAAGLTPANREATLESCYDELGNYYEVPVYCLRDPDNLVRLEEEDNNDEEKNNNA